MPDSIAGSTHGFIPIKELFGAAEAVSVQQLAIYLPDCDKTGKEISESDMWIWIDEALKILSRIGGGASAVQDVLGAWLNPENGDLIRENTTIVYTYIQAEKLVDHIADLRAFLHQFGSETNQGMVLFHLGGTAYRITTFDDAPPKT